MSVDVSSLNAFMDAAVAALAGGDYATALRNAAAAQGIAAVLPDLAKKSGPGGGDHEVSWTRQAIAEFISTINRLLAASAGVQETLVNFAGPSDNCQAAALGVF